jgi:peptidyl-prolyl cis-trans isomerase A (cyclophilin A)
MRTFALIFSSLWFATTAMAAEPVKPAAKAEPAKAAEAAKAAEPAKTPVAANPVVEMTTTEGTIKIELDEKAAPVSTKNFLMYVNDKHYDGVLFHRVIKDFMVQGGGYTIEGDKLKEKPTKAPIINEAKNGLKNNRGTIAMARTSDPNSATAQFFINHVDNGRLDPPSFDGHGYAVFGKVVEGMDVVDKIANTKTGERHGMSDFPATDIKILSAKVLTPKVN